MRTYSAGTTDGPGCLWWVLLFVFPLPVAAYVMFLRKDMPEGYRTASKLVFWLCILAMVLVCVGSMLSAGGS